MFWKMTGLSPTSPVDTILDKENYTLEELLDEDEIIQECKALNTRLITFLRDRTQEEQLLRYIVEEAPVDAEKKRIFKFPFIACEIFTCEVDIILRTLVEDEELMNLLFSFLKPEHSHSTLLAGYFSKVVISLLLRKTTSLMNYIKSHQEILCQLVDLIGITSIMEVLIRLVGAADENMYSNYNETMQWLEDTNILEMIVDKFSSSDCPEVHANAAEVLSAITRSAPPALATKICSPIFIGRLFRHALDVSRPKSAIVQSLSVCMSLLDPKRLATSSYQSFRNQLSHGPSITAKPETVDGMLESIGDLLKLLDASSSETTLLTTYGTLQPPLGKHRLKIVEFISVLLTIGSEDAEKELIRHGAFKQIIDLFFDYPFNNFLHHHVENIIGSSLESNRTLLIEHILNECDLVSKILDVEKEPTLTRDPNKPTVSAEGKSPPRVGNIGHMSRITNKLVQYGNNNNVLQTYLQKNNEWVDWHTNVLLKRNAVENVYQWACGRPNSLHDPVRDSDDEDFGDRDYDVAALANNLSQAFRYGIYSNDDTEEAHGSLDRDDEDVYFDDESAEVVISSLRLGDDQDSSSLFTNSNWFAFEDDKTANETDLASDPVIFAENGDIADSLTSLKLTEPEEPEKTNFNNEGVGPTTSEETEKMPGWVEWRETSGSTDPPEIEKPTAESEVNVPSEPNTTESEVVEGSPEIPVIESLIDNASDIAESEAVDAPEVVEVSPESDTAESEAVEAPEVVEVSPESDTAESEAVDALEVVEVSPESDTTESEAVDAPSESVSMESEVDNASKDSAESKDDDETK